MRWCRPRSPVDPMYMPGRLRTASRPSRTWIAEASYAGESGVGTGAAGASVGVTVVSSASDTLLLFMTSGPPGAFRVGERHGDDGWPPLTPQSTGPRAANRPQEPRNGRFPGKEPV